VISVKKVNKRYTGQTWDENEEKINMKENGGGHPFYMTER
jgi:hypothetical protein